MTCMRGQEVWVVSGSVGIEIIILSFKNHAYFVFNTLLSLKQRKKMTLARLRRPGQSLEVKLRNRRQLILSKKNIITSNQESRWKLKRREINLMSRKFIFGVSCCVYFYIA